MSSIHSFVCLFARIKRRLKKIAGSKRKVRVRARGLELSCFNSLWVGRKGGWTITVVGLMNGRMVDHNRGLGTWTHNLPNGGVRVFIHGERRAGVPKQKVGDAGFTSAGG